MTPDYVSFYSVDNPSAGAARLSLEEFCADVYRSTGAIENPNDSVAVVATLFWHKEPTGVRHEFLLAQVCQLGRNDVWLRLERGAKRNGSALRRMQLASSVSCPADDSVSWFILALRRYLFIEVTLGYDIKPQRDLNPR